MKLIIQIITVLSISHFTMASSEYDENLDDSRIDYREEERLSESAAQTLYDQNPDGDYTEEDVAKLVSNPITRAIIEESSQSENKD